MIQTLLSNRSFYNTYVNTYHTYIHITILHNHSCSTNYHSNTTRNHSYTTSYPYQAFNNPYSGQVRAMTENEVKAQAEKLKELTHKIQTYLESARRAVMSQWPRMDRNVTEIK